MYLVFPIVTGSTIDEQNRRFDCGMSPRSLLRRALITYINTTQKESERKKGRPRPTCPEITLAAINRNVFSLVERPSFRNTFVKQFFFIVTTSLRGHSTVSFSFLKKWNKVTIKNEKIQLSIHINVRVTETIIR